jgi:hypothetical protein
MADIRNGGDHRQEMNDMVRVQRPYGGATVEERKAAMRRGFTDDDVAARNVIPTRNAGGEQMILPLLEQEQYDSYSVVAAQIVALEQQQETIAADTAAEALAILSGEVDV